MIVINIVVIVKIHVIVHGTIKAFLAKNYIFIDWRY